MNKKDIQKFLDKIKWPDELDNSHGKFYKVKCDDDHEKEITVSFSCDGDAWVGTDAPKRMATLCRARTKGGGGNNFYTRQALMVLALAMEIDNE